MWRPWSRCEQQNKKRLRSKNINKWKEMLRERNEKIILNQKARNVLVNPTPTPTVSKKQPWRLHQLMNSIFALFFFVSLTKYGNSSLPLELRLRSADLADSRFDRLGCNLCGWDGVEERSELRKATADGWLKSFSWIGFCVQVGKYRVALRCWRWNFRNGIVCLFCTLSVDGRKKIKLRTFNVVVRYF